VRALAAGPEAFVSALEQTPDYDAGAFELFLSHHKLLDWVAPELTSDRAKALVPDAFRAQLVAYQATRRAHNAELLGVSEEVRDALARAGLGCLYLKGLYFGQRFYGDANRRHQGDVDVLVRSAHFEAALEVLDGLGFDVMTNLDDGKPVAERLREIRGRVPAKAPHAVTVRRGVARLDLHWCLDSRSVQRVDEDELWTQRRRFSLSGSEFETLSDEHTLTFLLTSICGDLRRGACREKHFLDLHQMLRELDSVVSWEDFCERRRREGVLAVAINVLAVFLNLWDCAAELPGVVGSVTPRLGLVELRDGAEVLALMERPRGNLANRIWFRRVHPRSRWRSWVWRLSRDLPHTLERLKHSRGFPLSGA
jgi:hypothetical protein